MQWTCLKCLTWQLLHVESALKSGQPEATLDLLHFAGPFGVGSSAVAHHLESISPHPQKVIYLHHLAALLSRRAPHFLSRSSLSLRVSAISHRSTPPSHVLPTLPSRIVSSCLLLPTPSKWLLTRFPLSRRTTAGSLYPAYASYKAIKSNDLQKLEVWLMYWVVMGFIMCMESTVEWLFAWSVSWSSSTDAGRS